MGITIGMEFLENNLNRIYRGRMREVHPDRAARVGLNHQQSTEMLQRLNDDVEEMRMKFNLPPGQNFDRSNQQCR